MSQEYLENALQEISDEHLEEAVTWEAASAVQKKRASASWKNPMATRTGEKSGSKCTGKDPGAERKEKTRGKVGWKSAVALVTAAAVIAGVVIGSRNGEFGRDSGALRAFAVSEAEYPAASLYPDPAKYPDGEGSARFEKDYDLWSKDRRERNAQVSVFKGSLDDFWTRSITTFLVGSEGENLVYSPVNVYLALAMSAEITGGNTRQEILDLLGVQDVEALREQASAVWKANYMDDGASTSILGSSLWLSEEMEYVKSTLDTLAEVYYASSYRGKMGAEEMDRALQTWLNEQTGGLLEEYVETESLDPRTVIALATTICYQAKWADEFSESNTEEGIFYSPAGDVECDFMYEYNHGGAYYWGEKFGAVNKNLDNGHSMWFILPDEGVSVDDLLNDAEAMEFLTADSWENSKYLNVRFYLPKFDVSSKIELTDGLKRLGLTDIFDPEKSDFTPLTDFSPIVLSQANHAARVTVDEEGVTAAAYTLMLYAGAGMPPDEEIEFKLDRPFLFMIKGAGEVPLFVGVVNQP